MQNLADQQTQKDYVSRGLFGSILQSEEDHEDWPETQLGVIDKMSLENYIPLRS